MKRLLFLLIPLLYLNCKKENSESIQNEFVEITGEIRITERITFLEEDNFHRFRISYDNEEVDTNAIRFRLGSYKFAYFESLDYEFDELKISEMWLLGGNDCDEVLSFGERTYTRYGDVQVLKFDPEEDLWDCMVYAQPVSVTPLTFSIFARKKSK